MHDKVSVSSLMTVITVHKAAIYMNNRPPHPSPHPQKGQLYLQEEFNFGLNNSLSSKPPSSSRSHVVFARRRLLFL